MSMRPSWSRWASNVEPVWFGTLLIFAQSAIGGLTLAAIYVMIFGSWFLSLPEKSLEPDMQGARNIWSWRESWNFKGALFVVYACPVVTEAIEYYLSVHFQSFWGDAPIWLSLPTMMISLLSALFGLTLLSITYRRNLQRFKANSSSRSPPAPARHE